MGVIPAVDAVFVEGDDHGAGVGVRAYVDARLQEEAEIEGQVPPEIDAQADLPCERRHDAGAPVQLALVDAVIAFLVVMGVAGRDARAGEQDQAVVLPFRPEDRVVVGVGQNGAQLLRPGAQEAVEIGAEGEGVGLFARGGVERRRIPFFAGRSLFPGTAG